MSNNDKLKAMMQAHIAHYEKNKDQIRLNRIEAARTNQNCLSYWYPIVSKIEGIKTPKTKIYPISLDDQGPMLDGVVNQAVLDLVEKMKADMPELGPKVFVKNSLFSGKHNWKKTCCLEDPNKLMEHFLEITNFAALVSCDDSVYWVMREFLDVDPAFFAFEGQMPVTKERRYFIENGKVKFHHPYWPDKSILNPSIENWQEILTKLNDESIDEIKLLKGLSEKVSQELPGAWSVDWLQTKNGDWYLIDMAQANKSFCWTEYPLGKKGL